jgi:rSAM/selenodomain-associated transferase 1
MLLIMQSSFRLLDPHSPHKAPPGACALAVMIKVPRLGAVKTRLVPPLTVEQATALNICFLRDMSANIAKLARQGSIHGVAAYTPRGEEAALDGALPPEFQLLTQRGTDLGDRLFHAFEDLFQAGYATACLINSDSPTLPRRLLCEAIESLRQSGDRMVLGEAADGGYYLIGLKRPHRRLFDAIDWSTNRVLRQTLERASEIRLESKLLPVWYDIDDAVSLRRLCAELFTSNGTSRGQQPRGYCAPQSAQYLRRLLAGEAGPRLELGWGPEEWDV